MNDCIKCSMMFSGGDMSSRLWKCDTCGRSGFYGPMLVIERYAKKVKINEDKAWDLAYAFLNSKREEAKKNNTIYFDEDRFEFDLEDYFNNL